MQNQEQWLSNKESTQNFNKASFLNEHQQNFEFLSQFIETQMFTNFIDNKIHSYWSDKENNLRIFDNRIELLKYVFFLIFLEHYINYRII